MRNLWKCCAAMVAATAGTAMAVEPNDTCETATPVVLGANSGTNATAVDEALFDPSCQSNADEDVWFTFTPGTTAVYRIDTEGSSLSDTVLTVYSGVCGSLTEIACDDDSGATPTLSSLLFEPLTASETYYIRVAGFNDTNGAFNLNIAVEPIPANDTCAGAEGLSLPASVTAEARAASSDLDVSCDITGGSSALGIWYSFTPGTSGVAAFAETGGSNTFHAFFTGTCAGLTEVFCSANDHSSGLLVTAGTTYYLLVGAEDDTVGLTAPIAFTLDVGAPPANDTCATAETIMPGGTSGTPVTFASDDADVGCNSTSSPVARRGVWYTYTPTADQSVRFAETSSRDTVRAFYSGTCGSLSELQCDDAESVVYSLSANTQYWWLVADWSGTSTSTTDVAVALTEVIVPTNDNCASATVVSTFPSMFTAEGGLATGDGTVSCDADSSFDVWYSVTAPSNGALLVSETGSADAHVAIFTGSCGGTQVLCSSTDTGHVVTATMGTTYIIRIADPDTTAPTSPYEVTIDFAAAPANDNCAMAEVLSLPTTAITDARGASAASEPLANCSSGADTTINATVWYQYTATADGSLRINETSSANVSLAVFQGACPTPTLVPNSCSTTDTDHLVPVTMGQVYLIRVAHDSTTAQPTVAYSTDFELITAPANSTCASATAVSTFPFNDTVDGRGSPFGEPVTCDASAISGGARFPVWYTFTAPANGAVTLDEPTIDVALAAFTGACGALTQVHCSDPEPTTFNVVGGTQYWVQFSYWFSTGAPAGPYNISIDFVGTPPANDFCETAEALSLSGGTATTDARAAEPDQDVACDTPSVATAGVWYSIATMADGGTLVLDETTGASVVYSLFSGPCESLTPVICDLESATDSFQLAANTSYKLLVSNNSASPPTVAYSFNYTFTAATGACCNGMTCSVATFSDCSTGGGTYIGDNASCSGGPNGTSAPGPFSIPDANAAGVDVPVTVSGVTGAISNIEVEVDIAHTWVGDVALRLTAPDGVTTADLMIRPASTPCPAFEDIGDGDDLVGVYTFSDAGTTTIHAVATSGTVTIPSGTYQAADCTGTQVLLNSVFAAATANGTWTLKASDEDGAITGSVNSVSIFINGGTTPPCDSGPSPCDQADFDGSGTVDATDIFIFLDAWFAQNGMSGPNLSADTDGSGTVDATDIFIYLDLWFANNGQTC